MLKRINAARPQSGMHLHELCGSWMSRPFWRASFLLKDTKDIRRGIDRGHACRLPSAQCPARPDSGAVPGNTQRCRREHQET